MSLCQFIRSYRVRGKRAPRCTISQAACAAIASIGTYEPLVINQGHNQVTYIDAMTGFANPTSEGLKEAERVFGKDEIVATIVSVGNGKADLRLINGDMGEDQVAKLLRRVATDTEHVHEDIQSRFRDLYVYFRFNVEHMPVSDAPTDGAVKMYSAAYLEEEAVSQRLDIAINSLRERKGIKPLKELSESLPFHLSFSDLIS
jgi:hypothetical protein